MNTAFRLLCLTAVWCVGTFGSVAADVKIEAGPKGGRILEKTNPKAEFFIEQDHTVTIAFYDNKLQPMAAANQSVTVIADDKGTKTKLEFEKKGDLLVSKAKLPAGDGYNLVVQFKNDANSKPQNFRFTFDSHTCGGCHRAEYACTCDH